MKWAVAQIRKLSKPYSFEYDFDLFSALVNKDDIKSVEKCHVSGTVTEPSYDNFDFNLHISLELTGICAVSLEDVPYTLEFDSMIRFTYNDDCSSDCYLIDKETINLDNAVLSEIVLNLPYRYVKEGYEDYYMSDEEFIEENPNIEVFNDNTGGED